MMNDLSPSLNTHPLASQWIEFLSDGTVLILSGKVELGQGISAALIQTVADELGFKASQIKLIAGDTQLTPDEGYTAGSQSIEVGVKALKHVCRLVKDKYARTVCEYFKCSIQELELSGGEFKTINGTESLSFYKISEKCPLSTLDLSGSNFSGKIALTTIPTHEL